jgi:hypothetical protein
MASSEYDQFKIFFENTTLIRRFEKERKTLETAKIADANRNLITWHYSIPAACTSHLWQH